MPNTHFRYVVQDSPTSEPRSYRVEAASETTARARCLRHRPLNARITLQRYEFRSDSWKDVARIDFDQAEWGPVPRG